MEAKSKRQESLITKTIDQLLISCRICMNGSKKMVQIFKRNVLSEDITDMVKFCTGVQLIQSDDLPKQICKKCVDSLRVSFKFKKDCLLSDKAFTEILENKIKKEDYKSDSDDEMVQDNVFDNNRNDVRDLTEYKVEVEINPQIEPGDPPDTKKEEKEVPETTEEKIKKRFYCSRCDIQFCNRSESEMHKRKCRMIGKWMCEICGKVLYHRSSHYTHLRSHMPPKYGCAHCTYMTQHKFDLVKHIRTHTGIKQYQCEYCTSSYHVSSNLKSHIRRCHQGIKNFQCQHCEKTFYEKTKLNRHIDSHNSIKRYSCEICKTQFTRRHYWKKHIFKQHGIELPIQRPGRKKTNLVVGETLINEKDHIP